MRMTPSLQRLAHITSHLCVTRGAAQPAAAVCEPVSAQSEKVYRVCMLGARARATSAARAYHAHPRCQIVGVCDLVEEVLNKLSDELGVPPQYRYTDLDKMIEERQPDIVSIPVATELHYPLSMRVLKHSGVAAIDVEKPLCETLEQADEVLSLCAANRVLSAVHHQGRCGNALRTIKQALAAGRIGKLRHIIASDKGYYVSPKTSSPAAAQASSGCLFVIRAAHSVCICQASRVLLLGPPAGRIWPDEHRHPPRKQYAGDSRARTPCHCGSHDRWPRDHSTRRVARSLRHGRDRG